MQWISNLFQIRVIALHQKTKRDADQTIKPQKQGLRLMKVKG